MPVSTRLPICTGADADSRPIEPIAVSMLVSVKDIEAHRRKGRAGNIGHICGRVFNLCQKLRAGTRGKMIGMSANPRHHEY